MKGESRTCQEMDFYDITEELQTEYLDSYVGFQAQMHKLRQSDESSPVSTTFLVKLMCQKMMPLWQKSNFHL